MDIRLEREVLEALGEESISYKDLVWMLLQLRHPIRPPWVKEAYQNGWFPVQMDAMLFPEIAVIEETIKHLIKNDVLKMEHGYITVIE